MTALFSGAIMSGKQIEDLQGGVRFPTGSRACEPHRGLIRCDSVADGIVRMEEDM